MDKTKNVIKISNKRIYDYYNANPNINIETMNLILLDFIEQLGNDMTKILSTTVFGEILSNVKEIKQQVNSINDNFAIKLQEHNKSFIETTKLVIGMASNENTDKIIQVLNRNTDSFIEKINISIPKTQEETTKRIQEHLSVFQRTINDDIKTYLSNNNSESSLKEFISTLDSKIMTIQQPIYNFLSSTVFGEILSNVKEIKQQVNSLNENLALKLQEHNKSFIETTKLVIGMASNENTDKISQLLIRNTDSFFEKINTSIPKTQEETTKRIQEHLSIFQRTINDDIKSYLSTTGSESSLKEFISTLDSKIMTIQQPIYTFISSSQEQLNTRLNTIREDSLSTKSSNDKIMSELNDFLSKYKTSSQFKGQCSENMVGNILNKMFPTAEVINTTALKASGDFILKRQGKSTILLENKNYEANVNIDEIKKFLRDINEQKTNGIMMSQFSGIVSKPNGFIEIHDGKVLIYLHNVDYSPDKIKMAIDIIDNLYEKLEEISNVQEIDGIVIKKDVLDRINDQFQTFLSQKEMVLTTIKELQKKLTLQVEDMKMPDLSLFLNDKYASIQNQQFCCEVCNLPFQNKRSLGAHKKIHKGSKGSDDEVSTINVNTN